MPSIVLIRMILLADFSCWTGCGGGTGAISTFFLAPIIKQTILL